MSSANFVQEVATAIAGTSGNGDVTLAASTGSIRFSTVFGTAKRLVEYVIQQTSTGKLERGLGYVTNNVLSRTRVKETWDGTNYLPLPGSSTLPSALQFGSSPTTGDVVVRAAPLCDSFAPIAPAMQTSVGAPADGFRYSAHIGAVGNQANMGAFGATLEWYVPFKNIARGVLSGIEVTVKTAGSTGATLKTAIYEVGPDGLPGQCITQFNALPATTTGAKQDTAAGTWSTPGPIPLSPGWYYIGFVSSDAAVASDGWSTNNIIDHTPLGRANNYGHASALSKTQEAAGNLPSGIPTGTYTIYGQADGRNYGIRLKVLPT